MKPSIQAKLEQLGLRFEEVSGLMAEPTIQADNDRFRELGQEYAQLEPVMRGFQTYQDAQQALESARSLLQDEDPEMRELARDEIDAAQSRAAELEKELQVLLLPQDPKDSHNCFLEIRAGTGGAEAALFAGDLCRAYLRYAEQRGWRSETVRESAGEHGGYKEVVLRISGRDVFSRLKFESGAHRVQRVPETESQGRIHTSACTVAVLPEAENVGTIEIEPGDLRVDTFRASGAGGQHVNKTDSAIRLTHLPTGVVVECQDERSQHKNRARAMSLLQSRLQSAAQEKADAERAETRRNLVGSGDRSERIRTYNYPQGRVTDHRINLTLYKLDAILAGDLDPLIEPLIQEHRADLLAELGE